MDQSAQRYRQHDFSNDPGWKAYLDNIYPTPPLDKLENFRRKYYQRIDPAFNPDCLNQQPPPAQSSHAQPSAPAAQPFWLKVVYNVEGVAKVCYFLLGLTLQYTSCLVTACCICLLALLRICKVPQLNKEYAQKVLLNEFSMNLLYCVCLAIGHLHHNIVFQAPLAMHFAIGVAEFIRYQGGPVYSRLQGPVEQLRQKRNQLLYQKASLEVKQLLMLCLLVMFNHNLLSLLIYGSFIRMKYLVNHNTQHYFYSLDSQCQQALTHPSVPPFLRSLYSKVQSFCKYLVKM